MMCDILEYLITLSKIFRPVFGNSENGVMVVTDFFQKGGKKRFMRSALLDILRIS